MAFGKRWQHASYVASGGGEQISMVDLTQGIVTGRVLFPPLPFNASFSPDYSGAPRQQPSAGSR